LKRLHKIKVISSAWLKPTRKLDKLKMRQLSLVKLTKKPQLEEELIIQALLL